MTFTKPTEIRYRSPSGREQRAALRGTFKPTLPPLPAELPEHVADYLQCLNRRERRKFAAKARAHAAKRAATPRTETIDGATTIDRAAGKMTLEAAALKAYRDCLVFGRSETNINDIDFDAGTLGVTGPHKPGPDGAIPSPATKDPDA